MVQFSPPGTFWSKIMLVSAVCLIIHSNSYATATTGTAMYSPVLPPLQGVPALTPQTQSSRRSPGSTPQRRKQSPWDSSHGHSTIAWLSFGYTLPIARPKRPLLSWEGTPVHSTVGKQPCQDCPMQTLHPQIVQSQSHTFRTTHSKGHGIAPPKLIVGFHAPHLCIKMLH